jgi:hypothetical protein
VRQPWAATVGRVLLEAVLLGAVLLGALLLEAVVLGTFGWILARRGRDPQLRIRQAWRAARQPNILVHVFHAGTGSRPAARSGR